MFTLPSTYKEGMEEVVKWANSLPEDISRQFMLDVYRIYIDCKFLLELIPQEDIINAGS